MTRRLFLKVSLSLALVFNFISLGIFSKKTEAVQSAVGAPAVSSVVHTRGNSKVYVVSDGSPEENIKKILHMMGGIGAFIDKNDIVVIKPNAQRYNQGMTNTDAIKGFIDLVLAIEGFSGEIIIAENHQYQDDACCGWTTENRNGQFNLYELVEHYQKNGIANVTKYHWHVAGPCTYPLQGNGQGDRRVTGPEQGDGYVWLEECAYLSPSGRKCVMTYPVFTSEYSGIRIDLKNGAWQNGTYLTDRKVKFINFSALNHHGRYAGVSASVKNLMGVVDMTCGFPGDRLNDTYNTHHIGVSRKIHWLHHGHWRIRKYKGRLRYMFEDFCYRDFHHTGGALGYFMANIRSPDLNIIAADLVGWGDRRKLEMAFRPKAVLASQDPVALDYIAAREILYPNTPEDAVEVAGVSIKQLNNPDDWNGPFYKFLRETAKHGPWSLEKNKIEIVSEKIS